MKNIVNVLFFFIFLNIPLFADNSYLLPVAKKFDLSVISEIKNESINYEVEFSTYKYNFITNTWDTSKIEVSKSKVEFKTQEKMIGLDFSYLILQRTVLDLMFQPADINLKYGDEEYETKDIGYLYGFGIRYFIFEDYPLTPAFSVFFKYSHIDSSIIGRKNNFKGDIIKHNISFGSDIAKKIYKDTVLSAGLIVINTISELTLNNKKYPGTFSSGRINISIGRKLFDDFYFFFNLNFYNQYNINISLIKKFQI